MLQKMGEHIHGWIAGIIVVVISAAFVLFGLKYYIDSNTPMAETIAKVNGVKLTGQQLQKLYRQAVMQDPSLASASSAKRLAKKKLLVDNWVQQQAVQSYLANAHMTVSPDFVRSYVMATFKIKGQFIPQYFQTYLQRMNLTEQQFYEQTAQQLAAGQFLQATAASALSLPNEIRRLYQVFNQKRTFRYAMLNSDSEKSQVKVTDSALKQFYQAHLSMFTVPEKVSVNYVELSPSAIEAGITLTDAQLKQFYQAHLTDYTKPATWKFATLTMADLRNRYVKEDNAALTARFNKLVQDLKDHKNVDSFLKAYPAKSMNGKTLTNPDTQKVLNSLQPGEVSKVQTGNVLQGNTVFYLVASTPKQVQSFADAKSAVKKLMAKQQANTILADKNNQMTSIAFANPDGLQAVAKQMGLTIHTTEPFTHQGLTTGPAKNPAFITAAFGDVVLTQGVNSDPVTFKDGTIIFMHLNKHYPAHVKSFAAVKDQVQQAYVDATANAMLAGRAQQLTQQLNAGKAVTLSWKNVASAQLRNSDLPQPLMQAVFDQPFSKNHKAVAFAVNMQPSQVAVVQLQSLSVPAASSMGQQDQTMIQQMVLGWKQHALQAILQKSLMDHSKIKVYKNRITNT